MQALAARRDGGQRWNSVEPTMILVHVGQNNYVADRARRGRVRAFRAPVEASRGVSQTTAKPQR
jgi:hypothetical protein